MKRTFDIIFSVFSLLLLSWLILLCFIIASIETQSNGFFVQKRVGQWGNYFKIFKIKTIHPITKKSTRFGEYFRLYKLDEIPQFFNVLLGNMSVVGPRPDIMGYYDTLEGENKKILHRQTSRFKQLKNIIKKEDCWNGSKGGIFTDELHFKFSHYTSILHTHTYMM